jgi:creatinine amidohydrolase
MKPKSILFAEHTRRELRELAPSTLLVLPLGATEQHGPHLPTGTDFLTVEHLAREAARQIAADLPVLVAPTLPFGCSEHHLPFGGTLSFTTETYYRMLCDLLRSLVLDGFQRIFLLNGHGGNHELIQLAARDMALAHPVQIAAASYWNLAWEDLLKADAHIGARLPGHAGRFETSLMLALQAGLVDENRPQREVVPGTDSSAAYAPYRHERHGSWQAIDGYSDSPANGSAELGHRYLPILVGAVARTLVEFARTRE